MKVQYSAILTIDERPLDDKSAQWPTIRAAEAGQYQYDGGRLRKEETNADGRGIEWPVFAPVPADALWRDVATTDPQSRRYPCRANRQ